jgi:hypothetical protein
LRKRSARTVGAFSAAIGQILKAFTPQECADYFENSKIRTNLISSRSSTTVAVKSSDNSAASPSLEGLSVTSLPWRLELKN